MYFNLTTSSTPPPKIGNFSFSMPTLARQMDAASKIITVSIIPGEINNQLQMAREFEGYHRDIYLPIPEPIPELKPTNSTYDPDKVAVFAHRFHSEVTPWFVHDMRKKFGIQLKDLRESESPYVSFQKQELLDMNLAPFIHGGLITYGDLNETLDTVEKDVERLIDLGPNKRSKIFDYTSQLLKSPVVYGTAFGALAMLMGTNISLSLVIGLAFVLIAKEILYRYLPPSRIYNWNDDVVFEDLNKALTKIRDMRTSLALLQPDVSDDYPLPPPDTAELRKAWFLKRAKEEGRDVSGIVKKFRVVEGPADFRPFAENHLHFVIVQLPDEVIAMQPTDKRDNREIRIAREDVDHDLLVLKDETKLCEGSLVCLARGESYTLLVHGAFMNHKLINEPHLTAARLFKDTLHKKSEADITISEIPGPFASGEWELIK